MLDRGKEAMGKSSGLLLPPSSRRGALLCSRGIAIGPFRAASHNPNSNNNNDKNSISLNIEIKTGE